MNNAADQGERAPQNHGDQSLQGKAQLSEGTGPLTFGQKAVGLTFNPRQNPEVKVIKEGYAAVIDMLNDMRYEAVDPEVKRMLSIAITETQTAQMWAVKAVTWN